MALLLVDYLFLLLITLLLQFSAHLLSDQFLSLVVEVQCLQQILFLLSQLCLQLEDLLISSRDQRFLFIYGQPLVFNLAVIFIGVIQLTLAALIIANY